MTASPTALFAESANKSDHSPDTGNMVSTCAKNAQVQPASVAMPSEGEMLTAYNAIWQAAPGIDAHNVDIVRREAISAVRALFAPILAEKEKAPYSIGEPEVGWRSHGSFSPEEKAKLRPVAETLAMLDGNAFFGNEVSAGAEWYEQYLPEAHALYEGNGGDSGWAGEASFAKPDARALAAEAALEKAEGFDFGNGITVESRGDGRWAVNNCGCVLNSDGDWEHEPRPSSRDDDFISRTRFDRDEAFRRAAAIRAQGE